VPRAPNVGCGRASRGFWGTTVKILLRVLVPVVALATGFGAMAALGGCGSNAPAPSAPVVRGKLTLNGAPVGGAWVVFAPDPRRGHTGPPARAETAPDGTFALPAVRAGWYRVALAGPELPAKLARPDLSGIEREVRANHEHTFEIAVDVEAR
jgi:hypothetical protein